MITLLLRPPRRRRGYSKSTFSEHQSLSIPFQNGVRDRYNIICPILYFYYRACFIRLQFVPSQWAGFGVDAQGESGGRERHW